MDFEVIWSEFAENRLDEIFEYYLNTANERITIEIVHGLLTESLRLEKDPFIG
ncbi:hypothetical protein [Zunongwangia sp. H14]|uniref:hypothetical protein n=1 Tax=Zunongwangia sp. H14 TaxID=3240792 RepID=UPI00356929EF